MAGIMHTPTAKPGNPVDVHRRIPAEPAALNLARHRTASAVHSPLSAPAYPRVECRRRHHTRTGESRCKSGADPPPVP